MGAGAVSSVLILTAAAPAGEPVGTDLTPIAVKARMAVGLPSVSASPAIRAAVGAVLEGTDPEAAFAAGSGTGDLVTTAVPAGAALSTAKLKAVVFDPRVTSLAVFKRGRSVAAAAVVDPTRPFPSPVLAGAVVDPGIAGSLAVLIPPGSGTIPQVTLQTNRGGQQVQIGIAATAGPGIDGAILVALKGRDRITGPQVGYGLTYTLKVGTNRSFTVRTRPIPSVLVARSWVPGPGFTGSDRRRFVEAVTTLPPPARKILDVIGGAITVRVVTNSTPICGAPTSCAGFDPSYGYFMILNRAQLHSELGRFVILHELGHLVDFLGLDTFSYEAFRNLFSESPNWERCFPLHGSCTPFSEVFADQFGFYTTNAHGIQSGYNDDRLATAEGYATGPRGAMGIPATAGPQSARRLRPAREELRDCDAQWPERPLDDLSTAVSSGGSPSSASHCCPSPRRR